MKGVIARRYGGIDGLRYEKLPSPKLARGTIRVLVKATGVSFANLLMIAGKHQNKPELPFIPGGEIAGIVAEIASDVKTELKVGDRVCAAVPSGGLAEESVVDATNVWAIPNAMNFEIATAFPSIYATAFLGLNWLASMRARETLLVHGAAGASGLAAVDVGKAMGAQVIATAGSREKVIAAKEQGADYAIDYKNEDFRERVLEITGGRGADVVFDPVGGDVFDRSLRCVAPLARLIPMGFASGRIPQIPANLVLVKSLTVIGLYWGYYLAWGKTQADAALRLRVREMFKEMFALYERGLLRPRVERVLPMSSFAEGYGRVERREVIGKVVLDPSL
ncbi:NADPH:quinone oxidoreductase family protein [Bradyrhizobium sp. USDA 4502]